MAHINLKIPDEVNVLLRRRAVTAHTSLSQLILQFITAGLADGAKKEAVTSHELSLHAQKTHLKISLESLVLLRYWMSSQHHSLLEEAKVQTKTVLEKILSREEE